MTMFRSLFGQRRSKTPDPTPEPAPAPATQESATKKAAREWAEQQREHAAWIAAAAAAETAMIAEICRRDSVYFPSDYGRGSLEIPRLDVASEPVDLYGRSWVWRWRRW
jgi:hypothetical protein